MRQYEECLRDSNGQRPTVGTFKKAKHERKQRAKQAAGFDEYSDDEEEQTGSGLTKHYLEQGRCHCKNCGVLVRGKVTDVAWGHYCYCQAKHRNKRTGLRKWDFLFTSQLDGRALAAVKKAIRVYGPLGQLAFLVVNRSLDYETRKELVERVQQQHPELLLNWINVGTERWVRFAKWQPDQFVSFQILHNELLEARYGPNHQHLRWKISEEV